MGSQLCCEADLKKSMIFDETARQSQFIQVEWPENDAVLQEWIQKNQKQKSTNIRKHCLKNQYFIGQWVDGYPASKGVMYNPGLYIYCGEFHDGRANGIGKIQVLEENSVYEGQITNGKAEGNGVYENLRESYKFDGIWESSKPKKGKLLMMNDPNVKEIQFVNFAQRKATVEYHDGRKYEGHLEAEKLVPDGLGNVIFPRQNSKKSYQGEWKDGKMHGIGTFKWRDDSEYEGSYVNGQKEGYGKFIYQSGKIYKGFWKSGKQDGTGILYEKIGIQIKRGLWKKGQFSELPKEEWENQNRNYERLFGIPVKEDQVKEQKYQKKQEQEKKQEQGPQNQKDQQKVEENEHINLVQKEQISKSQGKKEEKQVGGNNYKSELGNSKVEIDFIREEKKEASKKEAKVEGENPQNVVKEEKKNQSNQIRQMIQ